MNTPSSPSQQSNSEEQSSIVYSDVNNQLPISSERDMMVPISFALMKHNYSKLQIRAVIGLIKKLQNDLKSLFKLGTYRARVVSKDNSLSFIFKESDVVDVNDGKYEIIFKMSEFHVSPKNYYELEQSLVNMSRIPVQIPFKVSGQQLGEKGSSEVRFIRHTNLCDVSISDNKYKRFVIFSFAPDVAQRFISTDFGYLMLYDSVIMKSNNRYTQLIYMFISQFRNKGFVRIQTIKFRNRMNITDKYPQFRNVRQRVLDVAKKNLDRLFDEGECDLKFTYECEYKNPSARGGEPDYLMFHIIKRINISAEEYAKHLYYARERVNQWLRQTFKMKDEKTIAKYLDIVSPDNLIEIENKFDDLCNKLRNSSIIDKQSYCMKAIENLFNDLSYISDVE